MENCTLMGPCQSRVRSKFSQLWVTRTFVFFSPFLLCELDKVWQTGLVPAIFKTFHLSSEGRLQSVLRRPGWTRTFKDIRPHTLGMVLLEREQLRETQNWRAALVDRWNAFKIWRTSPVALVHPALTQDDLDECERSQICVTKCINLGLFW